MFHLLLGIIYLAFISLGLPDSLLGSAWPVMYLEFSVPVSYAGVISMIISAGTIFSSLQSDRLTRQFGTGRVTAASVCMTAVSLLGFSTSGSYLELCLWAVPYGLGAGSVDASLNNYVALYYTGSHMSWLHCMWGVGASLGPYIMGAALEGGHGWNMGYRCIAVLQFALSAVLAASLPLWKKRRASGEKAACLSTEAGPCPLAGLSGSQVQKKFWRPFSATALWSRRRDFGLAAIWCYAGEFQQRRRPVLSACFSLELRREERSAAF